MIECDQQRMEEKIKAFSQFGDTGHGGITRLSLSEEAIMARKEFVRRCLELGMEVRTDDLANIYATLPGEDNTLPAIYSGSHMDSVKQGGNYDGILGVLSALEMAETLVRKKIPHRHPITVAVWTNEEGARFEPAMMSSGIIAGKFEKKEMLLSEAKDIKGYTFGDALKTSGFVGDINNRISQKNCLGLIELHAEQGPVLDDEKKDIGVVEGVCGMVNYEFTFLGQADHAGTTPMKYRKDALYAAVKAIQYLHDKLDRLDENLVYTIGKISAYPNIHTVIPEEVKFTLDARHQQSEVMAQVVHIIEKMPKELEGCIGSVKEAWSRNTVHFHKPYIELVQDATKKAGYSFRKMYSGAGHDAQYLAEFVPTTMIFVPSIEGHSHCEKEYTPPENCIKGVNILLNTILEIDKQ